MELCPVCEGSDTFMLPGFLIYDDCPACEEGLVPHDCQKES